MWSLFWAKCSAQWLATHTNDPNGMLFYVEQTALGWVGKRKAPALWFRVLRHVSEYVGEHGPQQMVSLARTVSNSQKLDI